MCEGTYFVYTRPFPPRSRYITLVRIYSSCPSLVSPLRSKYQIGSVRVLRTSGRSMARVL